MAETQAAVTDLLRRLQSLALDETFPRRRAVGPAVQNSDRTLA
jgi:hypothetical protein